MRPGSTPSPCSRPTSRDLRGDMPICTLSLQIVASLVCASPVCVTHQYEIPLCLSGTCQRPMMATGISWMAVPAVRLMPSSRKTRN